MRFVRWLVLGGLGGFGAYWLRRYLRPEHSPLILNESAVLITGASSGLGRAFANSFARRGAKIALAGRRAELLDEVAQEIAPYAADVLVVPTDLTEPAQLLTLVEKTLAQFGWIDVLINNAGLWLSGPLHTAPVDRINDMITVNLTAAVALTRLCLPAMLSRRSGRIVNVASAAGAFAIPLTTAYTASKHGLLGFSKALHRELEGTGVTVIDVLPFWVRTDLFTPRIAEWLESGLVPVDNPHYVAERTIDGILKGERQIAFGGAPMRSAIWLDRHFPALMDLFWRATITPETIAAFDEDQS